MVTPFRRVFPLLEGLGQACLRSLIERIVSNGTSSQNGAEMKKNWSRWNRDHVVDRGWLLLGRGPLVFRPSWLSG